MEIGVVKTFFCGGVAGAASVFGEFAFYSCVSYIRVSVIFVCQLYSWVSFIRVSVLFVCQ